MNPATPDRTAATNNTLSQNVPALQPVVPASLIRPNLGTNPTSNPAVALGAQWPGAFEALGLIFAQIKKNPQPAIIMIGLFVVLSVVDQFMGSGNHTVISVGSYGVTTQGNYKIFAYLLFLLAMPIYTLALADRKTVSLSEVFKLDIKKFFFILFSVILLSFIIVFASLPLLIPLIWIIPWFSFVFYEIADNGAGPISAFKQSKALGEHHKGKVWGIIGATILMSLPTVILGLIPVVGEGTAAFVSGLISLLEYGALAMLYRWILHNQGSMAATGGTKYQMPPQAPQPPQPPQTSLSPTTT